MPLPEPGAPITKMSLLDGKDIDCSLGEQSGGRGSLLFVVTRWTPKGTILANFAFADHRGMQKEGSMSGASLRPYLHLVDDTIVTVIA